MSVPMSEVALKDYLFNHDAHYRELATEHRKYEERLTELTSLLHPNDDELIEDMTRSEQRLEMPPLWQAGLNERLRAVSVLRRFSRS